MVSPLRTLIIVSAAGAAISGCSLISRSAHDRRIFVSNYKDDTVSVIAGDPDREIKVIPVGDSPVGLALRPHRPLLAVANSTGDRITLIDPVRLEVVRTVEVGEIPEHVAFSVDGKLLFVTLPKAKTVAVIDPDSGLVRESITLERKPKRLAVSPDGRRLYVLLHTQEGGVAVVDIATRRVETTIPTGAFPTDFALTPDGRRLLAASFNDDTVTVIDTESLKPIATWGVDTGRGLIVHPTKPIAYSNVSFEGEVRVLNYETGALIASLSPGEFPTYSAITPDGRFLYVVNEDSNNVVKVDTETNRPLQRIGVGLEPANAVVFDGN